MAVETNARIEFSVASVEEWEKVNPKLHQGEPVFAKKPSGKYILKVGAPGGSTYKNAVVVWDQDDAETKMTSTQDAAAQALASKNAASASASAAKASENAAAASKSAAATSEENAKTSETNAAASANTSKAWSMSDSSPDGATNSKSSKTWAEAAKVLAGNAASSASTAQSSAETASYYANAARAYAEAPRGQAPNGSTSARLWAEPAGSKASAAASSASAAASSASDASTSASNAKISETNAANSAKAAKQSEENAKTWDPTQYVQSVTESNGKVTVTKGGGETNTFDAGMTKEQLTNFFYPIGSIYVSADKNKTKADFPFMQYGTWEEVPANLCLQTGNASEAGTQRSAGLPNITGHAEFGYTNARSLPVIFTEGALNATISGRQGGGLSGDLGEQATRLSFNASKSNSIYGSSNTVQPPAYIVRAWVRTA